MQQRSIFRNTRMFVGMTTDLFVIGGSIVVDQMKAAKAGNVRSNAVETAEDIEENLDICDNALDRLETRLADESLSPRRKQRALRTMGVWEATALTVERTVKL
jgi:hypothetical protein